MIPPGFLPPSTPRPIASFIRMGTAAELKRAIIPLAVFVAQGHIDYLDAVELLVRAFMAKVWSGRSAATVLRFEERAHTALWDAIERYEAYPWVDENGSGTWPESHEVADSAGV